MIVTPKKIQLDIALLSFYNARNEYEPTVFNGYFLNLTEFAVLYPSAKKFWYYLFCSNTSQKKGSWSRSIVQFVGGFNSENLLAPVTYIYFIYTW